MQIMTILGSALDENSLVSTFNSMERYEIADDVSRRYVLPKIKEQLNNSFNYNTVNCDLYISLETFEPIGFRIFDEEKGEDFFFDDISDISRKKEESKFFYTTICQYLGCKAIRETSS